MSKNLSLKDVQAAYEAQYGDKSPQLSLGDVQAAYNKQYGATPREPNTLETIAKNIGSGLLTGAKVGLGGVSQLGRNIGDLEWKGIHKLGNALHLSSGPAKTYNELYGSPAKSMGLPDTEGYNRAINLVSGLAAGAVPGGLGAQMAMGAMNSPDNPFLGAAFGAAGVGAAKGLGKVGQWAKIPGKKVTEKIFPSDKTAQAQAANWMNKLSGMRNDLQNTYKTGYKTIDIAGSEPVHETSLGYIYPDMKAELPKGDVPLSVRNFFPRGWNETLEQAFAKNSPIHRDLDAFEENPTVKAADKLKRTLNAEWPKYTDKDFATKVNLIEQGKDVLRNEFIAPTLARYDAEHGTNLWDQYINADKAKSQEINLFGRRNKLDVATKGGAYTPKEYKELASVLDKAVKDGQVPVGSPVHLAANDIQNAIRNFELKKAIAQGRGKIARSGIQAMHLLTGPLSGIGLGLQAGGLASRPVAQLLAQKYQQ